MESMKGEKLLSSWQCANKIICKSPLTFFVPRRSLGWKEVFNSNLYYKLWWTADIYIQKSFFKCEVYYMFSSVANTVNQDFAQS